MIVVARRRPISSAAILAAVLAGASIASAATLDIDVGANTTIRESATNQGASQILFAGDTTTSGDFLRSAVAFDLSAPELVGATINSATVSFFVRGADSSSENATITLDLHQLSSSFTNDGATWLSRDGTNDWTTAGGDFGGVLASASGNPRTASAGDSVAFSGASLASAVEAAVGGDIHLLVKSGVEGGANRNLFQFASTRNLVNSATGPVLSIDYTPVPEASIGLLGMLGGLFLLRRRR